MAKARLSSPRDVMWQKEVVVPWPLSFSIRSYTFPMGKVQLCPPLTVTFLEQHHVNHAVCHNVGTLFATAIITFLDIVCLLLPFGGYIKVLTLLLRSDSQSGNSQLKIHVYG